ncbi:MAG: hypothetical protein Solumvirus3_19 [Solumvirus sp.]|uniref:Uncharacterized protein n=1 Tax=Solumvirus sp. TaxID=2487773 RepID=A0A3G5AJS1_9VIRU|nr:MAG: hypothetical protein Solumvirus3_19 [Solumvirus sp.]
MSDAKSLGTVLSGFNTVAIIGVIIYYNNKLSAIQQKIDDLSEKLASYIKNFEAFGTMTVQRIATLEESRNKVEATVADHDKFLHTHIEEAKTQISHMGSSLDATKDDIQTIVKILKKHSIFVPLSEHENPDRNTQKEKSRKRDNHGDVKHGENKYNSVTTSSGVKADKSNKSKKHSSSMNNTSHKPVKKSPVQSESDSDDDHASDVIQKHRF